MSLTDTSTRPIQIVSGSSSCQFTAPNIFTYRLPASGFRSSRDEVALKSLTVYFSWPNISAAKGNNSYAYLWQGISYPVVMADGIWSFADVNSYLQVVMKQNGHYLVDGSGLEVYYLSLVVNPTLYCLTLVADPLPTTLPASWTNPAAINLALTPGQTPQLVIPPSFATFTGFSAGTYPAAVTTRTVMNSGIPQISDATSMNVICDLVDNSGFSLTPNILASFVVPSDTSSGSLIQLQPSSLDWTPIRPDTYPSITIRLTDQLGRPLVLRDPAGFVAILNVRRRM